MKCRNDLDTRNVSSKKQNLFVSLAKSHFYCLSACLISFRFLVLKCLVFRFHSRLKQERVHQFEVAQTSKGFILSSDQLVYKLVSAEAVLLFVVVLFV